ncbi:hypothetical protein [Nocardioides sp.]|uniref:hypothetical protein n=1 Tax=Nocardioides sp. TaxID=35761 RepID=UPI002CA72B7B|nr:hypothetical protein [Nocardioides sp.]HXH79535.1 hypothetical protein [Nocardioides sp.]
MGVQAVGARFLANAPASRTEASAYTAPVARYDFLEGLYDGTLYDEPTLARGLERAARRSPALTKNIRAITTLPKSAIERWPGYLFPAGRIPYDLPECNPLLIEAWEQAMRWGGWTQRHLLTYAERLPLLGVAFAIAEVADDLREVYPRLIHPRELVDLELSIRGDVKRYEVAIPQTRTAANGTVEKYVKHQRVDKATFRRWEVWGATGVETNVEESDNPFGFCPAILEGGPGYRSRLDGLIPMIHQLNGSLSDGHDFIGLLNHQTTVVTTTDPVGLRAAVNGGSKATAYDEFGRAVVDLTATQDGRQSSGLIPMPVGSQAFPLLSNLGLADSLAWVNRLERDIRTALPELSFDVEMSGVRELGVRVVVARVQEDVNSVYGSAADRGIAKLAQMGAAMMGEYLRQGMVPNPTAAHEPFRAFTLDSFDRGEMPMAMRDREVLPPTMLDLATEAQALERLTAPFALRHAGFDDEEIYGPAPDGETDEQYAARTRPGILVERQTGASSAGDVFSQMLATGRV